MTIPFDVRVSMAAEVLVQDVAGESVLLNLKSERYFGLDDMGTNMWQTLTTEASIQATYDKLLEEYDVEADQLRRDLSDLVENLVAHGLVEVAANERAYLDAPYRSRPLDLPYRMLFAAAHRCRLSLSGLSPLARRTTVAVIPTRCGERIANCSERTRIASPGWWEPRRDMGRGRIVAWCNCLCCGGCCGGGDWRANCALGLRQLGGRVEAHAWVEYAGCPLNERGDGSAPFVSFDRALVPESLG